MASASGIGSIQEFSDGVRLFSLRYRLFNSFAILTFSPSVVRETSILSDGSYPNLVRLRLTSALSEDSLADLPG